MAQGFLVWALILLPSIAWGCFCGYKLRSSYTPFLAAFVPWLGLLFCLIVSVYVLPNDSKDASMWLVAQLFGGSIMAVVGYLSYRLVFSHCLKRDVNNDITTKDSS